MRVKRGKDSWWRTVKYKGDLAIYAKCKCGFRYNCSTVQSVKPFKVEIDCLYHYCPNCGAHKKWYEDEPIKINKFTYE